MDINQNKMKSIPRIRTQEIHHPTRLYFLLKRLVDILASFFGMLFLSPLFILVIVLLKRERPGASVFYRGLRLGRGGLPFSMLKFRSMQENGETSPRVTACDDERITPLGGWLRDSKLNELPQLWNVFIGQMSLVGPRPEDPEITSHWPDPVRDVILSIRPGITSPASVLYRNEEKLLKGEGFMDDYLTKVLPDKLRLDYLYVRSCNILSDLDVLLLTFLAILPRLTKNPMPEKMLFWGPLSTLFQRYFSWFLVDNLVAFVAVALSVVIRRISGPLDLGIGKAFLVAVSIGFGFSLVNTLLKLNRIAWSQAPPTYVIDLAFSTGLTTVLVFTVNWFFPAIIELPPGLVINIGTLAFLGFVAIRYRERLVTGLASRWVSYRDSSGTMAYGERVLIVGAGECGQLAAWLLLKSKFATPYNIVGLVDDDPRKQGQTIDKYPVLGQTLDIPLLVKNRDIGLILFAINKLSELEREKILAICRTTSARLVIIPDVLDYFQMQLANQE